MQTKLPEEAWTRLVNTHKFVQVQTFQRSLLVSLSISSCKGANSLLSIKLNSWTKNMKCLKDVFKCASSLSCTTSLKCWWYMCAYTRNNLFSIVLAMDWKFFGNGTPEKEKKQCTYCSNKYKCYCTMRYDSYWYTCIHKLKYLQFYYFSLY